MGKQNRLTLIKSSQYFTTCKCCNFTYMAMSNYTEKNCPKCKPQGTKTKIIESDYDYLHNDAIENNTLELIAL